MPHLLLLHFVHVFFMTTWFLFLFSRIKRKAKRKEGTRRKMGGGERNEWGNNGKKRKRKKNLGGERRESKKSKREGKKEREAASGREREKRERKERKTENEPESESKRSQSLPRLQAALRGTSPAAFKYWGCCPATDHHPKKVKCGLHIWKLPLAISPSEMEHRIEGPSKWLVFSLGHLGYFYPGKILMYCLSPVHMINVYIGQTRIIPFFFFLPQQVFSPNYLDACLNSPLGFARISTASVVCRRRGPLPLSKVLFNTHTLCSWADWELS